VSGTDDNADAPEWTPAERALLDSALDFYGAAVGLIDLSGSDRPRLRYDIEGLRAVGDAMAELEGCLRKAHKEGVPPERIAEIARLEPEMVAEMLRHDPASAPPEPAEG
jgi:hypothetical protein